MNLKTSNWNVLTISPKKCRVEFEIEADQRKPLLSFLARHVGKFINAELKLWREKRSLDANAYAWVLMTKIADVLTMQGTAVTKEEVYLRMLKDYGQCGVVKIKNQDAERWQRWQKYTEPHEKLTQENAQYWKFYVGSSEYDTHEMSVFISGIVQEAKQLGIETMTPDELERMMTSWQRA